MLFELLLLAIVVWVMQRRWLMRKQRALANQLRTNLKSWPIVGHTLMFMGTDEDVFKAIQNIGKDAIAMGGISKFMFFDHLLVCVADPVIAEVVMRECLEKHHINKGIDILIGNNGTLLAPVPIWRPRRRIISTTFNSKTLAQYVETFSKHSTVMANLLEKEAGNDAFSFFEYISTYALSIGSENIIGVDVNAKDNKFHIAIEETLKIVAYRLPRPWLRPEYVKPLKFLPGVDKNLCIHRRTVRDFIRKIISEKKIFFDRNIKQTLIETNDTKLPSYLERQLQEEDRILTDEDLIDECLTLIVGSYGTTINSTTFIVMMLGRHAGVQDKVYDELQEVFGDSDRPVSYEDLPRLRYLEAVVKETLRLYPAGPLLAREVDKDIKLPSGVTIVKGCGVFVSTWALNRNPEYWGADADQFRPERFLDASPRHHAAFTTFGIGPRNCAGLRYGLMSLKTVVATLVRRYRVLAPRGVPQGEPLRTRFNFLQKPADNYLVRLERRK